MSACNSDNNMKLWLVSYWGSGDNPDGLDSNLLVAAKTIEKAIDACKDYYQRWENCFRDKYPDKVTLLGSFCGDKEEYILPGWRGYAYSVQGCMEFVHDKMQQFVDSEDNIKKPDIEYWYNTKTQCYMYSGASRD